MKLALNYVMLPLEQGGEIVYTKVDREDVVKVLEHTWSCSRGYAVGVVNGRITNLHRFVVGLKNGDSGEVDHINHDKLDNRKGNLRIATRSQNVWNTINPNTTMYRGVHRRSQNSFRATLYANGTRHTVGRLRSYYEAALVYNELAVKYHGQFAVLNELPKLERI